MSKYIIELEDDIKYLIINGKADDRCYTLVRPVAELEELNSDYINEYFGQLQDEAYRKGFEGGKLSAGNGCDGCKYSEDENRVNPCCECARGCIDHYEPAPHSDRIEVGDEVIWKIDNVTLIVTSTYESGGLNWCDGIAQDGKVYRTLIENDQKTGKHYDIQSILEAMRE